MKRMKVEITANGQTLETTAELQEVEAGVLEGRFADFCYVKLEGYESIPQGDEDGYYVIWFEKSDKAYYGVDAPYAMGDH